MSPTTLSTCSTYLPAKRVTRPKKQCLKRPTRSTTNSSLQPAVAYDGPGRRLMGRHGLRTGFPTSSKALVSNSFLLLLVRHLLLLAWHLLLEGLEKLFRRTSKIDFDCRKAATAPSLVITRTGNKTGPYIQTLGTIGTTIHLHWSENTTHPEFSKTC